MGTMTSMIFAHEPQFIGLFTNYIKESETLKEMDIQMKGTVVFKKDFKAEFKAPFNEMSFDELLTDHCKIYGDNVTSMSANKHDRTYYFKKGSKAILIYGDSDYINDLHEIFYDDRDLQEMFGLMDLIQLEQCGITKKLVFDKDLVDVEIY